MRVRPAEDRDAEAATQVLRRSIVELCEADHRGDPAILDEWLENKTPQIFRNWLAAPGNLIVVAEDDDGNILGVGGLSRDGEITLNYVSPDARFEGVSKALMAALEQDLMLAGHQVARLRSTATAHRFYRDRGYEDDGPKVEGRGGLSQPMIKPLG